MFEVSVIIPVYNASEFLEKAVQSALQFGEVKEVILVEDQSTDNSLKICEKLASENPRVKLYQHPDKGNHGAGATRNLGLEKAQSEFIAFLDSDDYYLPNRFEAEKEIFKDPKIDGIFGAIGVDFLSEKGEQEYNKKFNSSKLTTVNYPAEGHDVFKGLINMSEKPFGVFFHLNGLTIRREALVKHLLQFNKNLRVHQDSDFIVKLSYHTHLKSGIIDKAIAMRGIHDNNRITKIKKFSPEFDRRQFLLRQSLYEWAKTTNMDPKYREHIYLFYLTFRIARKKGVSKFFNFVSAILSNRNIVKTRYRYYYLHK
ncbi:glycosyltransferase involved in cell wall biosynthesis [Chryseobacterium defluvii]|uniref:Glycosyltransferase involved in cell wall biosynthesis n=1 Tax=Chryseobacterium defluvii TaxID=160396 RepID=A0A840KGF5_9FLAO|nr:glycosyltransferase family 2 protein [Chryseobacterium defluvii]MBB4806613.1 glycosyltransferase involved in cell wall biosynthesis [Chryseobacterium defluvii]